MLVQLVYGNDGAVRIERIVHNAEALQRLSRRHPGHASHVNGAVPPRNHGGVHSSSKDILNDGDIILSLDGALVSSIEEFRQHLRGAPGSVTHLMYAISGSTTEKKLPLRRSIRPDGTCWLEPQEPVQAV